MKFEKVKRYKDIDLPLPQRATAESAGYDFYVAEETIIPSLTKKLISMKDDYETIVNHTTGILTLEESAELIKKNNLKPTLVPTGIKCELPTGYYLELTVRSSTPLKNLLILANGVGKLVPKL